MPEYELPKHQQAPSAAVPMKTPHVEPKLRPQDRGLATASKTNSSPHADLLAHLQRADSLMVTIQKMTSEMVTRVSRGPRDATPEISQQLTELCQSAAAELNAARPLIPPDASHSNPGAAGVDHCDNGGKAAHLPKAAPDRTRSVLKQLTDHLAHIVADIELLSDLHPKKERPEYYKLTGSMIAALGHVTVRLGYERSGFDGLLKRAAVKVNGENYEVIGGTPRDVMLGAVLSAGAAFNATLANMIRAVAETIDIVSKREVEQNSKALDFVWERAAPLVHKLGASISGASWPTAFAQKFVTSILAFQAEVQKQKVGLDVDAYCSLLNTRADEYDAKSRRDGGPADILGLTHDLALKFDDLGKHGGDQESVWKPGDQSVVGAQAAFLRSLHRDSDVLRASVPERKCFIFSYLTGFVNANAKRRERSALRSPLESSTYRDGYVGVRLVLRKMPGEGEWFLSGDTGILHSPNAGAVARNLMITSDGFSLDKLDAEVVLDIEPDDDCRGDLPAFWGRDRALKLRLDRNHMIENRDRLQAWGWLCSVTRQDTNGILQRVRRIGQG